MQNKELSDNTNPVKNDQVVLKKSIIDGTDELKNLDIQMHSVEMGFHF